MTFVNTLYFIELHFENGEVSEEIQIEIARSLVLMLAPFAPFLSAELWSVLGQEGEVLRASWPAYDAELTKEDEIEIPVQINGKLRAVIRVAADADNAMIEAAALAHEKIIEWLAGKTPAKIIVVPGKLVNLVVK
jgi:leucyl-tRNA synthetase